jgi:hypothetical protein
MLPLRGCGDRFGDGIYRKSAICMAMGNEKFEDISVLKALVGLRAGGLLHPHDSNVLVERLQTDLGRKAAADFLSDNHEAFAEAKSLLRRFSVAA